MRLGIFTCVLFLAFNQAYAGTSVPLPQYQEMVAMSIESHLKSAKSLKDIYSATDFKLTDKSDIKFVEHMRKDPHVAQGVATVSRQGRVVTLKYENIQITIEVVNALNEQYIINGYNADLLAHRGLEAKYKFLENLLSLKGKNKTARNHYQYLLMDLLVTPAEADTATSVKAFGATAGAGYVTLGACVLLTGGVCGAGIVVGAALVGAVAYFSCGVMEAGICASKDVKIGNAVGSLGAQISKLAANSDKTLEISCSDSTLKLFEPGDAAKASATISKNMTSDFKTCCSLSPARCESTLKQYFDARNSRTGESDGKINVEGVN